MKTYHLIVESGGKNVYKKFSEQFYVGMWNNFFKICINSSAIDQKGWKSLFVWSILVWIYTILVWIHSTLVWFNVLCFTFTFVNNKLSELFALCCIITIPIPILPSLSPKSKSKSNWINCLRCLLTNFKLQNTIPSARDFHLYSSLIKYLPPKENWIHTANS